MAAIVGRVAPKPKGEWDSATTYNELDVVRYGAYGFMAKQTSLNQPPADNEYWMQLTGDAADMVGATDTTNGTHGLVPAPVAGDNEKVLFGDGTFRTVKSSALLLDDENYIAIDYSIL